MGKININDENYEIYNKLNEIKKGNYYYNEDIKNKTYSTFFLMSFLTVVGVIGYDNLLKSLAGADTIRLTSMMVGVIGITVSYKIASKVRDKLNIKTLKKENPNIDTEVNCKVLDYELAKHRVKIKMPKNIESKKEESINKHYDEFKKLTTQEKIAFLKAEQQFWTDVEMQEYYGLTEHKEKQIQKIYK